MLMGSGIEVGATKIEAPAPQNARTRRISFGSLFQSIQYTSNYPSTSIVLPITWTGARQLILFSLHTVRQSLLDTPLAARSTFSLVAFRPTAYKKKENHQNDNPRPLPPPPNNNPIHDLNPPIHRQRFPLRLPRPRRHGSRPPTQRRHQRTRPRLAHHGVRAESHPA